MNEGQNLTLERIFKSGKQGIAGNIKKDGQSTTFKVSQCVNYLAENEFAVMTRLHDAIGYCPNFCVPKGLVPQKTEPRIEKGSNPFKINSRYPITKNVLLEEYIEGDKMYKHIKYGTCSTQTIFSSVKQILSSIALAQQEVKFTHYDLHSDNIIMKPCAINDVMLYILNETNAFVVPTLGYMPVIIDYGFSYVDACDGKSLNCSMAHTNIGFFSDRFDWVSDPKLFLVTIFNELKDHRKSKLTKILENVTKNMFSPLTIDWECGWDDVKGKACADIVIAYLEKKHPLNNSKLFDNHINFSVDLLCCLITLPIQEKPYDELVLSYSIFTKEFLKIEAEISSSQYNLYILKTLVDSARRYKDI